MEKNQNHSNAGGQTGRSEEIKKPHTEPDSNKSNNPLEREDQRLGVAGKSESEEWTPATEESEEGKSNPDVDLNEKM